MLFSCSVGYRAATSEPLFRRFRRGMDAPLEGPRGRRRSSQACHSKEQGYWVNLIATRYRRKQEKAAGRRRGTTKAGTYLRQEANCLPSFTEVSGTCVLRSSCLVEGRIRDSRRINVVVDACRAQQSATSAFVHRNPGLWWHLVLAPAHAVVLDCAPNAVVGERAVL